MAAGCTTASPRPVRVAAAISLKEPLELAVQKLSAQGLQVEVVLGGSGDLARQISAGSPVDLFASASVAPLQELERAGHARAGCELARNKLVLIRGTSPALSNVRWETLATDPSVHHVAIGAAKLVPAGDYAESTLQALGTWAALTPRLVRGSNVRQVLELVERGEAEAGVVYATDVANHPNVIVVSEPPAAAAPRIVYELGVVVSDHQGKAERDATERVRAYLCGGQTQGFLRAAGFLPP
jgi:molybdate transport system substrate-binding protein